MTNLQLYSLAAFAPLVGAMMAGLLGTHFMGNVLGRRASHVLTIAGVAIAFLTSLYIFNKDLYAPGNSHTLYTWLVVEGVKFEIGFLVDSLTVMMMLVVTSVSLMVHVYTIGYMRDDPGYNRFFAYISLFTFSMLMLVMSNNFVQLFFGWEAVGLVSYLLIGFWYTRPTAIYANLKAFLVNRVGDFGFVLGIGLVLAYFGTMDYATAFKVAPSLIDKTITLFPNTPWSLMTVTCICLFIGAMGKSAQFPLHVWLPDSMEGPTPISALIHAATMVTAGIFMVARMSPLFELSTTALSFVIVIGAITALFMGFLGIVQNDIKRVVAYSTLSQLGYMTVALGASAYSIAVFHLMTHAFFKALLFLAAGSVIMGVHHNQDIRYMGGLRKYMPITWLTSLAGSLALIGTPFLSGFYSKDSIIEAAKFANVPGSAFAYYAVLAGVFITAFYSFRMYFLVFHGPERYDQVPHDDAHHDDDHHHGHNAKPHESPWVVWVPLVLLAIPSLIIGCFTIEPMLHGTFFKDVIFVDADKHGAMAMTKELFLQHGKMAGMGLHGFFTLPFALALAGVVMAYYFYIINPRVPAAIKEKFSALHTLLENKYYFDRFNDWFFAAGARLIGGGLWQKGDVKVIDGWLVNGSAKLVGWVASVARLFQTGYVYHYAFTMIIGILFLLTFFGLRR
jgi:NADH-quinone oxidoreductase subunit L